MSAELRGGRRRIATVLVASLGLVTLLYLLVNFAYIRARGLGGIAGTDVVAADLAERAAGAGGAVLISFLVAVSALTSANGTSITAAPPTYALGSRFPQLGWLGRGSPGGHTPRNALLVPRATAEPKNVSEGTLVAVRDHLGEG